MTQVSDTLMQRLKQVECPDATYASSNPALVMAQAQGSRVLDADGREYIDLCAGFGVLALGHNPLPFQKALARRATPLGGEGALKNAPPITHGMGDVYPSVQKVDLLEKLIALLPSHLKRAALALTGGQAVEIAVKTAMLKTGCTGFITFDGSYHGLDLGILPLTSRQDFKEPFADYFAKGKVLSLPFGCDQATLRDACHHMAQSPSGLAAIVVEPIQGRAGVRIPPPGWLAALREEASSLGAMLIFDEILTGLGRTGRLTFAQDVPCDLLCLGKALGGGLPLSACIGTEEAMHAWPESQGEALHTGTFFGHPLSCEVASETLSTLVDEHWSQRAEELGAWSREWLQTNLKGHPAVRSIRGMGLMNALELAQPSWGALLMDRLRQKGVIALASGSKGESLTMTPALNIPQSTFLEALERIVHCLQEAPFLHQGDPS